MTAPDVKHEDVPHTHDGEVELTIPPWLMWCLGAVVVATGVWLAIDVYKQRQHTAEVLLLVERDGRTAHFNDKMQRLLNREHGVTPSASEDKADENASPDL